MSLLYRLAILLCLYVGSSKACSLPALGQQAPSRSALEGTVTTQEGEPLPGATVFVPELDRGTAVGPNGSYTLSGLPARSLSVRFSFLGYEPVTRRVRLTRGDVQRLDVELVQGTVETESVVVTGTPVVQDALRSTQQVDVVSPEQLETVRTAALGDVLEESVPGAASIKTGAQAGKPVLRGLTGNRIRVLVDGVAQEYYQFGVRHFPNTSLLAAERVEVVRGPASILYGSDALGGAINLLPAPLPSEGLGGRAAGQYFANNQERAASLSLHGARGTFGARAGVERRLADDFTAPDEPTFFETGEGGTFGDPKYTGDVPFTNFEQWSAFGQVGATGSFGSVQLFGDYWQNRQNFLLPGGGPEGNATNPPVGLGQNLEHVNLMAKGTLLAGEVVLKPRLSFQRAIRQAAGAGNSLSVVDAVEGAFDWPIDLTKDVYIGRLEVLHPTLEVPGGSISGTVGVEAGYEDGTSDGPVPLEPSATVFNLGVFLFEELELRTAPLTITAGARLDFRTLEADPPASTREALQIDDLDNRYTTVSGSVGGNYRLADGVALVANLGTGFRAPSIFELYADGVHGGVAALQQGNPDLDPERSYSADAGIRLRTDRVRGSVTAYYNAIQDYIFFGNTGESASDNGLPVYRSDQTDAWIAGIEAALRGAVLSFLEVGAELALLTSEGEDLEPNDDGDRILPLLPANRLSGFVRLHAAQAGGRLEALFLEAEVRHAFDKDAAGRYEPFAQFDAGFGPPFGTASTRAYTLLDLTAGATLPVQSARPELVVGITNLFDVAYRNFLDTYKGYALSPGRGVSAKLIVPFGTP